ncbi:MAG: hypothetical protein NXY57DRAFT_103717 [Lentinula lateritia]|nr:MAG: hypothetical protein NXY57DRAFT_103717 [Lentinula lateritia]
MGRKLILITGSRLYLMILGLLYLLCLCGGHASMRTRVEGIKRSNPGLIWINSSMTLANSCLPRFRLEYQSIKFIPPKVLKDMH